eukprot:s271_g21.t1
MAIDRDVRFELLARLCPNTTGAECRSVCTEAGMYAIRARRKSISEKDLIDAINKVIKGYSKFSATPKYMCAVQRTEKSTLEKKPTEDAELLQIDAAIHGRRRHVCSDGAVLITADGKVLKQGCCPVPGGKVVDTTGAGDCFRSAFAVALVEGRPLQECLKFAAAAGAITVSRLGAVPSLPSRDETEALAKSI